jgi:hypothetical protein
VLTSCVAKAQTEVGFFRKEQALSDRDDVPVWMAAAVRCSTSSRPCKVSFKQRLRRIEALGHDPRLVLQAPAAPAPNSSDHLEPAEAVGLRTRRRTMITHRSRPVPIPRACHPPLRPLNRKVWLRRRLLCTQARRSATPKSSTCSELPAPQKHLFTRGNKNGRSPHGFGRSRAPGVRNLTDELPIPGDHTGDAGYQRRPQR